MSLDIHQIAEAFSSHRFVVTYPYLADEIKWNIVGREELMGREAVIDRCTEAARFLETVSTTFTELKTNRAETCVVVEALSNFKIRKIKRQAWPAVTSINSRMSALLRLHHTSLS